MLLDTSSQAMRGPNPLQPSPPGHPSNASSLLSPAASAALARTLKFWTASEQARVLATFRQMYADWHLDWVISPAWRLPDEAVWISHVFAPAAPKDEGAIMSLARQMFGCDESPAPAPIDAEYGAAQLPSMALDMAQAAWVAWQASVLRLIGPLEPIDARIPTVESPALSVVGTLGSGCISLAFARPDGPWILNLQPQQVALVLSACNSAEPEEPQREASVATRIRTPAATPPKCSPLLPALAQRTVSVQVGLQPVSLSLGMLQGLALHDVVVLPHALDQPAMVRLESEPGTRLNGANEAVPLCSGWLGQSQCMLAVSLIRAEPH